jgi:hypothetical protein
MRGVGVALWTPTAPPGTRCDFTARAESEEVGMVATTHMNKRLDEVYSRRADLLPELARSGPDAASDSVEWLERISRPGGLGGPNPHDPVAVRVYEAEVSLILMETLVAQQERISELEAALEKQGAK